MGMSETRADLCVDIGKVVGTKENASTPTLKKATLVSIYAYATGNWDVADSRRKPQVRWMVAEELPVQSWLSDPGEQENRPFRKAELRLIRALLDSAEDNREWT